MASGFRSLRIRASNALPQSRSHHLPPMLQALQRQPPPPSEPLQNFLITYVTYDGHRTQASLNNGDVLGYRILLHPDTETTIREFRRRTNRRWRGRSIFFDKFSAGYGRLPEGWVAVRRTSSS